MDYLLNEREAHGTAKLLQGDPELTKSLIDTSKFAQKSVVGVLSFEEANLSEVKKREIMEQFEKSFMSGLQKEQYNILWVEHTDKGRLELNFVIPTQELTTGKRIQPYYHKADLGMKDTFQDFINLKYDLSNPKDPEKEQTITIDDRKLHQKDYKELDLKLHSLVLEGKIDNREEMVALLRDSGIEVAREGKDYISVKLPESGKAQRFKGGIYGEEFRGIESIGRIREQETQRAREFTQRDSKQELRKLEQRVEQQRKSRATENEKRFSKQPKRVRNDRVHADFWNNRDALRRGDNRSIELVPLNSPERLASAERVAEGARREEVLNSSKEPISGDRRLPIHTDKRVKNDGITANAITEIRGRVQQRDERFGAQIEGIRKGARSLKTVVLDKVRELGERVVKLAEQAKERLSVGRDRGRSL